ncbi:MAG: DUF456 domain-containing protein [Ignavibacterium sp.]|nr:DUF456 domain-containing protein [Ignavibacterium sp.]
MLKLVIPDSISWRVILIFGVITLAVTILDYLLPIWGAKIYKASQYGIWGSVIGMIIGIFFFPPLGMIVGILIGAVLGELFAGKESSSAVKIGIVTFIASIIMIVTKLIISGIMTFYFMIETI